MTIEYIFIHVYIYYICNNHKKYHETFKVHIIKHQFDEIVNLSFEALFFPDDSNN